MFDNSMWVAIRLFNFYRVFVKIIVVILYTTLIRRKIAELE